MDARDRLLMLTARVRALLEVVQILADQAEAAGDDHHAALLATMNAVADLTEDAHRERATLMQARAFTEWN